MRSIVTHWRTSIDSGHAAVHWPLPLQASTQFAAASASPSPRVSAIRPPAISDARDLSRPMTEAVGQAAKHRPQLVQRLACVFAVSSKYWAIPSIGADANPGGRPGQSRSEGRRHPGLVDAAFGL